ncbi:hypothetical protein D0962_26140 [Leptolyngbyaceae cyanobacterium CCMR0082]|uniref:Uncharacterized protein n=1 Tax=Adonisia turfae CCMR0082 TaxID=2304604 RepID=A0A6M0SEX4_9CYAN|nr:hypothetical protein [Adonisia turfae]NEZ66202.1 hypothetical protein [Adonisia turfae CCMR0082]
MSHYLQTIVAKNMGHLSVVRPRLASPFEPPADTVSLMPQFPMEAEAETSESGPTITREPNLRQPQSNTVSLVAPFRSTPSSQLSQPSVLLPTAPTISDASVSPSDLKPRTLSEPLPSQSSVPTPNVSRTEGPSSASVVEPLTKTSLPRPIAASIPVTQHSPPPLVSSQALASSQGATPISQQPVVEPIQPLLVGLSQSQNVADDSSAQPLGAPEFFSTPRSFSRASSTPSSETSGPTIQVTIGRIDVRAVIPKSAPTKSSKSRPAKPSLQDYLKARNSSRHGV